MDPVVVQVYLRPNTDDQNPYFNLTEPHWRHYPFDAFLFTSGAVGGFPDRLADGIFSYISKRYHELCKTAKKS